MASKGRVFIETGETSRSGLKAATKSNVGVINDSSDPGMHVVPHCTKDVSRTGSHCGRSNGVDKTQVDSDTESSEDEEEEARSDGGERDLVEIQTEKLAEFIVNTLIGNRNGQTRCPVERTLLICVKTMLREHEVFLKGMMSRLNISKEFGYGDFDIVALELFDGGKAITWAKIIAFYTFGGRLALYCKEKHMEGTCCKITELLGKSASEFVAPFVRKSGGWTKLCEVFPLEDDSEDKVWQFLIWTALGFGLVVLASFLTKRF